MGSEDNGTPKNGPELLRRDGNMRKGPLLGSNPRNSDMPGGPVIGPSQPTPELMRGNHPTPGVAPMHHQSPGATPMNHSTSGGTSMPGNRPLPGSQSRVPGADSSQPPTGQPYSSGTTDPGPVQATSFPVGSGGVVPANSAQPAGSTVGNEKIRQEFYARGRQSAPLPPPPSISAMFANKASAADPWALPQGNQPSEAAHSSSPVDKLIQDKRPVDRFVPSAEAVMDSIVTSPSLPAPTSSRRRSERDKNASAVGGKFPGAVSKGRGDGRKVMVVLGALCFLLAGGLFYGYFLSPFGPKQTNDAALSTLASSNTAKNEVVAGESVVITPRLPDLSDGDSDVSTESTPYSKPTVAVMPEIKVYVVGAVKKPGVVSVPYDSRVADAIKAAGGFTDTADQTSIDGAKRNCDEDKIVVRDKSDPKPVAAPAASESSSDYAGGASSSSEYSSSTGGGADYSATTEAVSASKSGSAASSKGKKGKRKADEPAVASGNMPLEKVNINMSGATDLMRLYGIGPSTAEAIVQYREQLPGQRYSNVEQLLEVPGIGEAKLADMKDQIEL